jgi:antitoxin (DNA-binding transcriptional repressor) of toxin-antitoxin stability system
MKQISMREFQLNASQLIEDLPIALTRYGRVVAIVIPPEEDEKVADIKQQLKNIKPGTSSEVIKAKVYDVVAELPTTPVKEFWFNGKKYLVDENGNEKEVK